MGYRSEVRSVIYGTQEQLDTFITTHQLILNTQILNEFKQHLTRYTIEMDFYNSETKEFEKRTLSVLDLYGSSWKWYESYSDVQAWEKLLKDAEEQGLHTQFVRIGEEEGDIENRQIGDDFYQILSTHTSIIEVEFENKSEPQPI